MRGTRSRISDTHGDSIFDRIKLFIAVCGADPVSGEIGNTQVHAPDVVCGSHLRARRLRDRADNVGKPVCP